mmetsp:Transcript_20699/g.47998  ORF Transcript_20699/g.47998 Transcript_20699/m.47998 type:complete len:219 (-) Transcript_20699:64-720(-)|eukprot:CAMPEP_0182570754 /NCGR_PEP_ID=MMETSP1324-20130603/10976_1 /TAXON_ID=236786 /ORGANISM="Florenciella sp., Strain RCC1587" /LENGTH=218 /DNA_ID=CAMNT_0024785183 /DNA_START=125 /DNA_END=781 /DNA_ORIENTATION=-
MSAMATRSIRHIPVALRSMNHGRAASARCYSSLYAPVDDGRARRGDPVHDLVGDAEQPGLYGLGVKSIATRNVKRGEVIFHEAGPSTDKPTMHSIQVGVDKHVAIMGEGRYTAHSFEPNTLVKIFEDSSHPIDFVAARDIEEGEQISFDYTTTEWDMGAPFTDAVTGKTCRGFKHLPAAEKLARLREGVLPSHIMRLWIEHELLPQEGPRDGSVKTGE